MTEKIDCVNCRKLKDAYQKPAPCDEEGLCIYLPELFPENKDAIFVYSITSDQLRVAGMEGMPFAPDHNAIWTCMDKFEIEGQTKVFGKVRLLFNHFITKMQSERKNA